MDNEFNNVYTGQLEGAILNGFGELRSQLINRIYTGNFVNNKKDGYGEQSFDDGSIYRGQWKNDVFDGYGTHTLPDGRIVSGNYIEGEKKGELIVTHPSDQKVKEVWDFGDMKSRVVL